jgi:sphingolipid 8-(E)-desaturase
MLDTGGSSEQGNVGKLRTRFTARMNRVSTQMGAPTTVWTRDQVADRILQGEYLIVYRNNLIRVPQSWLDAHPGGSLAILHFIGRDATDEIDAYHSDDTLKRIAKYAVGSVELSEHGWEPLVPPIMSGWVRKMTKDGTREWFLEAGALRSTEDTDLSPSSQILLVDKGSSLLQSSAPSLSTLMPPPTNLSLKVQAQHSAAYKALHRRISDAGLYKTPYLTGYGPEIMRYILLGTLSAVAYFNNWLITSAVFLGLMWHQLVFSAHDLGHMGVTHNWVIDRLLGILIADFIGGLSIGWWVDVSSSIFAQPSALIFAYLQNHNVHHRKSSDFISRIGIDTLCICSCHKSPFTVRFPRQLIRFRLTCIFSDPDIEHIPWFAISPAFFHSLWSSYYKRIMSFDHFASFVISLQHKLFYIVMAFARFNLYANSYSFLFRKAFDTRRARGGRWAWRLEIIGLVFFWSWYGALLVGCGSWTKALCYLVVSHVVTSPLHVQVRSFICSPTAMF